MNRYYRDFKYWDKRICFYIVSYYIVNALNATLKTIFEFNSSVGGMISVLFGILLVLTMLLSLQEVYKRSGRLLIKTLLSFLFIYSLSYFLIVQRGEPTDAMLKGSAFLTFAWYIPVGIYAVSVADKKVLYDMFFRASFVISAILMSMMFLSSSIGGDGLSYSMTFGTLLTVPVLFHLTAYFDKKKKIILFVVIVEILALLIYANRAVLLSIIAFVLYKIMMEKNNKALSIFYTIIVLLFFILIAIFQDSILGGAIGFLEDNNIQSRTLSMMSDSRFMVSTEREELRAIGIDMILERPILGWGLGGEYFHVAKAYGAIGYDATFTNHNGIIQNFVCFGIVGGFIATILFIIPYFRLSSIKNKYTHDLILIFGMAILPIFISASGFFTKTDCALFLFLFYFSHKTKTKVCRSV